MIHILVSFVSVALCQMIPRPTREAKSEWRRTNHEWETPEGQKKRRQGRPPTKGENTVRTHHDLAFL